MVKPRVSLTRKCLDYCFNGERYPPRRKSKEESESGERISAIKTNKSRPKLRRKAHLTLVVPSCQPFSF